MENNAIISRVVDEENNRPVAFIFDFWDNSPGLLQRQSRYCRDTVGGWREISDCDLIRKETHSIFIRTSSTRN